MCGAAGHKMLWRTGENFNASVMEVCEVCVIVCFIK